MKHLIVISALFLMFGCSSDQANDSQARIADSMRRADDSVRNAVDFKADSTRASDSVARAQAALDSAASVEPTFPAEFRVLYIYAYCGGARPTEEMEAQHNTPQLLTSSTLKFKNHHTGKEYFLKTDAKGKISSDMEEGKYDVFFTKDINLSLATGFDPNCTLWTNQLLLTVKVTANGKMQDVNVEFVCNPCEDWRARP
jgi:hypothetical protein